MANTDEEIQSADSGASETYPKQCSALRKSGHVVIKGHACKIVEMSTSKTGKHGHAKVHLIGLDLITNKKYEDLCPSTHNMNVPNVSRIDYQIVDVLDGYLSLMDDGGVVRNDIKVPGGDLGKEITEKHGNNDQFMVTVMKVMSDELAVGIKNITK